MTEQTHLKLREYIVQKSGRRHLLGTSVNDLDALIEQVEGYARHGVQFNGGWHRESVMMWRVGLDDNGMHLRFEIILPAG